MKTQRLRLAHWIVTLLFVGLQGWAAIQFLTGSPHLAELVIGLGYPGYLAKMLGVATLLGIVAIVTGVWQTAKEWAYAGFAFEACGAFASHLSAGDSLHTVLWPAAALVLLVASFALWKRARRSAIRRRRHRFALYERDALESHA